MLRSDESAQNLNYRFLVEAKARYLSYNFVLKDFFFNGWQKQRTQSKIL